MQRGRPAPPIDLSSDERAVLESWSSDPRQARELALRARIVLSCASGCTNMKVAGDLEITRETVGKWRKRFLEHRVQGLLDEPRPGAPSTIRDEDVERVRRLVAQPPPDGKPWTTRRMARAASLSQTAISRIWKLLSLEPHARLPRSFPKEPLRLERVRFVAGLFLDPPAKAFALCHDPHARCNESSTAANGTVRGAEEGADGAAPSLFARLDAHSRKVNGHVRRAREGDALLTFLSAAERGLPEGCELHLVLGGVSVHRMPKVGEWLRAHSRCRVHFIPTSGAWLRLVELWARALRLDAERREREGLPVETSLFDLERTVRRYLDSGDGIGRPFRWQRGEARPAPRIFVHAAERAI